MPDNPEKNGQPESAAKQKAPSSRRWRRWAGGGFLLAATGWLVWFPPSLHQLTPWLVGYLSLQTGKQIKLSSLILEGGSGLLARDVVVAEDETMSPLLTASQVRVGLNVGDWLMTGKPLTVSAEGVVVQLPEGANAESSQPVDPLAIVATLPTGAVRLKDVEIIRHGQKWQGLAIKIGQAQAVHHQDGQADWNLSGVLLHGKRQASLVLNGQWRGDGSWQMGVRLEGVQPSLLKSVLSDISPLATMESLVNLSAQLEGGAQTPLSADWNVVIGKGKFALPELFRWPFPVTRLAAQGRLLGQNNLWDLTVSSFELQSEHGSSEGKLTLTGLGGGAPHLDLTAKARGGPVEKANYYYPVTIMADGVVQWLDTSLLHGQVVDAEVRIKGPLEHFPFDTYPTDGDGKPTAFRIEAVIDGAAVLFHPKLPAISQARTRLIFDRLSMEAHVNDGILVGSRRIKGKVRIADMLRHPVLEVNGSALADLPSLWQQVVAHPVLKWDESIGLAGSELKGSGELNFSLRLPLEHPEKATYQGELNLSDDQIKLPFLQTPFVSVRGGIHADNNRVHVMVEHADYGGVPVFGTVEADGISQPDKASVAIKMRGVLPKSWVASRLSQVAEKEVTVSGDIPLNVVLERPAGERGFRLESAMTLKNAGIKGFPGLDKKVGDAGDAQLNGQLNDNGQLALKKLIFKLAGMEINGQGEVDLAWLSKEDKAVKGRAVRPLALTLKGVFPGEALTPWLRPLLGEDGNMAGPLSWRLAMSNKVGKPGVRLELNGDLAKVKVRGDWGWRKEKGVEGQWITSGWLQKNGLLEVERLKGKVGNLEINGFGALRLREEAGKLEFKQITLGNTTGQGMVAKGVVDGKERYQIWAKLKELDLSHELSKKSARQEEERPVQVTDDEPWSRFEFALQADHVTLANGKDGKNLTMAASSRGSMFKLSQLDIQLGEKKVTSKGELAWLDKKDWGPYEGSFNLSTGDIGGLLKGMDWHSGMKGGEGSITLQVAGTQPRGERFLRHLAGKGEIRGKDGVVQEAKFLTTLLGLLSLPELPKLLTGDRPDLEGEGFYYKKAQGDFTLAGGKLKSDNITLSGPSMTIVVSGEADLPAKELNLLVGSRVFQTLDKIITQIPVVGKLIMGSRHSLWETQFDVTGKMDNPNWSVRAVDSLAPGIFRDILDLPGKMLRMGTTPSDGDSERAPQ